MQNESDPKNYRTLERVLSIISVMNAEEIIELQTELQYAAKWWDIGRKVAATHGLGNSDLPHLIKREAATFETAGYRSCNFIQNSELYKAVRQRCSELFVNARQWPANWFAWLIDDPQAKDRINWAIEVRHTSNMPIYGAMGVSSQSVTRAQEILEKYNIREIFISREPPTQDAMVAAFFNTTWNGMTVTPPEEYYHNSGQVAKEQPCDLSEAESDPIKAVIVSAKEAAEKGADQVDPVKAAPDSSPAELAPKASAPWWLRLIPAILRRAV